MNKPKWKKQKPSWKVLCSTDNKFIDVLNTGYNDRLIKILRKHKKKDEEFRDDIESWLFTFHARAQFEFSMVGARSHYLCQHDIDRIKNGATDASPGVYVDVYEQVMANFDNFIDYVWEHRKSIEKY